MSRAKRFFRSRSRQALNSGRYLAFSGSSAPSIISFLKNEGLKEVQPDPIYKEQRDEFLRSYLNVMDELAGQNGNDLEWWATDIASKSRFTSPLPKLLNTFARCLIAVGNMERQDELLVLVRPPWPVVCALENSARASGWNFRVLSWPWSQFLACWQGKIRTSVATLRGCLGSILQIWECRRYFGLSVGKRIGEKPVYLIKSFVYPGSFSQDNEYRDPFFGKLSQFLFRILRDKINILTVVVSVANRRECLRKMRFSKERSVVPLEVFLCWNDVLKGFQKIFLGRLSRRFSISGTVAFLGHEVTPLLNECFMSGGLKISLYQYLHLAAGLRMAEIVKPFSCALTFEGNPWERMLIAALRRDNSQFPVFGYQHSGIPQSAASVFIGPKEQEKCPLPTRVLTTGEIPARIIRGYGGLSEDTVEPACALRYQYLYDIDYHEKGQTQGKPLVLVALEGVWERISLLEYVLDQAPGCPNILFRIRAHPVLPLSKLLRRCGRRLTPGGNVEASIGTSVLDDVEDCSAVLYWASTVALEALMIGKPIIHFDRGDFLSDDPLFEFSDFKWTIGKGHDLKAVLEEIQSLEEEKVAILRERGRKYIRSYFHEIDDKSMSKFIPESPNILVPS